MALLKGTLDILVLKALSFGPLHGFEIIRWIEDGSGGEVPIEGAALLQALHRLEERRYIAGEWGVTENGRRAKYYSLTAAGRDYLRTEAARLVDHLDAIVSILSAKTSKSRA